MAIVETLSYIFTLQGNDFTIFSDFHSILAALRTFSNLQSKTYLICHIRDQLYRLCESGKKVKLYWIPADKGIIGNELVDQSAKLAFVSGCALRKMFGWFNHRIWLLYGQLNFWLSEQHFLVNKI